MVFRFFNLSWLMAITLLLATAAQANQYNWPDFTKLVKDNGAAVVNISTKKSLAPKRMLSEELPDSESEEIFGEIFKRFFDHRGTNPFDFDNNSRGSGFILSADGYVVTNHHVVNGADEIKVKLPDRREFMATLIGSDVRTDVALLKIEAENLPTLSIGNSQNIQVGEWVLAIGSPFGFDHSATKGIVSATERSLPNDTYVPFIQTDVAINPGNSGGPLFNLKGEVIGINSQIYSRSGGFMGVSFAIPVNVAMDVINQLKKSGKVSRGWLGVYIQDVDQELAKSFDMSTPDGALVAKVVEKGPSDGVLHIGDIILAFNDRQVHSSTTLPSMVGMTAANETVKVRILREGKELTIDMKIGELPSESEAAPEQVKEKPVSKNILGMDIGELDQQAKEALKLSAGVIIERVQDDPALKAGFQAGDVIGLFDGKTIDSVAALEDAVESTPKDKTVAVLIHRNGSARFIALQAN